VRQPIMSRLTPEGASRNESPISSHLVEKMSSLAMSNFMEPTLSKSGKLKSPLASVYSLAHGDDGGLIVSDNKGGKIVALHPHAADESKRAVRQVRVLLDDLCPYGVSRCGLPDTLAVVHSTEWDACVKIVSSKYAGQVFATWGRDLRQWTPRALVVTRDGHIVVSNIHQQATSRIGVHTIDGQQVHQSAHLLARLRNVKLILKLMLKCI